MLLRPRQVLAVFGAGALIGLAACGGGGGESNDPTPTIELTGLAREISDSLERGTGETYRITYQTTTPEGDSGDTYVVYNKPPLTRVDTVPAGQIEANTALIGGGVDDRTIGCSNGPDAWQCSELEPLGDSLLRAAGAVGFYSANELVAFRIARSSERTVAGQASTCYQLTPTTGGQSAETSEYCFTDQGVVLYAATPSITVEALDFAADVSDEDFDPPAETS
jgi:hypothetical protein